MKDGNHRQNEQGALEFSIIITKTCIFHYVIHVSLLKKQTSFSLLLDDNKGKDKPAPVHVMKDIGGVGV